MANFSIKVREAFQVCHTGIPHYGKSALETRNVTYVDYIIVMIFRLNEAQGTNLALMETRPGDELCNSAYSPPDPVCKYAVKSRDTLS